MDERGVPIKSDGSSGRTTRNAKRRCARRLFSKSTQLHTYTLSCASTAGSLSLSLSLSPSAPPPGPTVALARAHTHARAGLLSVLCTYAFALLRSRSLLARIDFYTFDESNGCHHYFAVASPPPSLLSFSLYLSLSLSLSLCSSRSLTLCYILFSIPRFIFCHF
jgi:hypothetical protein